MSVALDEKVPDFTAAATGVKVGAQSGTFSLLSENGNAIEIGTTGSGRLSRSAASRP